MSLGQYRGRKCERGEHFPGKISEASKARGEQGERGGEEMEGGTAERNSVIKTRTHSPEDGVKK